MQNTSPKQTWYGRLFKGGSRTFFVMFAWELVEEALEEAIAYMITSATVLFAIKVFSTFGIITLTQLIKSVGKKVILKIVKKLTYKEGNDKMNKVKNFFLGIWANKKTICGTISGALMVATGSGVVDISTLPELNIKGFNITPLIYFVSLGIITLIGVYGKGLESIKGFFNRMASIKAQKETNAIKKQAMKEIKVEEKIVNQTQAEQEKNQAKEKAIAEAKAKKEQADTEYRAKVDDMKKQILAEAKKLETK